MRVILDADKKIYGLSEDQKIQIKDELMVENPAYISAMKYSGYNRVAIAPYLRYYKELDDCMTIPLGYQLPFNVDTVEDLRKEVTVDYPPINIKLREVQEKALESYLDDTDKGMICLSTGAGKSILGIYIASILRQKTLVIVHKNDLVIGWQKDIKMSFNNKVKSGLIKAQSKVVGDQITIATIQTLSRMSEEELSKYTRAFGLVIVDEMHKIGASIYDTIAKFSSAYKIGLSATPERSDGLGKVMKLYLGDFCFISTDEDEEGIILPVEVRVRNSKAYFKPRYVEMLRGNNIVYRKPNNKDEISDLVSIEDIPYKDRPKLHYFTIDDVIQNDTKYQEEYLEDLLREYKEGNSVIVFLSQKEHCRLVESLLIDRKVPQEDIQLYYGDSEEPKEELMKKAEEKRNMITIATYAIATEGTNVKQWEVAFLLSSINNGKNVEQAIGRIRRVDTNKIDVAKVYDYRFPNVYTFSRHGNTRDTRYRKLNFKVIYEGAKKDNTIFSRGY